MTVVPLVVLPAAQHRFSNFGIAHNIGSERLSSSSSFLQSMFTFAIPQLSPGNLFGTCNANIVLTFRLVLSPK